MKTQSNRGHTRRRQTKQKHNTIKKNVCVWHHDMQTNTNNVNKTRTLLQRTGGKDEPKIALYGNRNYWIMSGNIAMYIVCTVYHKLFRNGNCEQQHKCSSLALEYNPMF